MKSLLHRIFVFLFLSFSLLVNLRCGAAENTGGSPPIDIPAPVSHLSISSPDANGLSRVTGSAGFADAGTTLTLANGGQGSASLMDYFVGTAWAQALVTAVAETDGSFQTEIAAVVGDVITVTYTLNGESESAQGTVTAIQPALPLTSDIQDAAVNGNGGVAGIIANDGTDGFLHLLNLGDASLVQTIALAGASAVNRVSFDAVNGKYYAINPENETVIAIDPATGGSVLADVPTPTDVAAGESGRFAVISHSSGDFVACYYDADLNFATSLAELTVPGGATHVETPLIDTDFDGAEDVFAVVSRMSDGVTYAGLFSVADASTYSQRSVVALTGVTSPGGLFLFGSGAEALVTDTGGDRLLRVNFEAETFSEITVGDAPVGVAVSSDEATAFVVNGGDDTLSVVSLSDNTVTATLEMGISPTATAIDKTGALGMPVVVNTGDETVTILE